MRYFKMSIQSTIENLEKNSSVRLKDYAYDCPISGLNAFMLRNVDKDMTFVVYDECKKSLEAVVSYNERHQTMASANSSILGVLNDNFKTVKSTSPEEVSMLEFNDMWNEAIRKGYTHSSSRCFKIAGNLAYDYDFAECSKDGVRFKFDEVTLPSAPRADKKYLVDSSLANELKRIKDSKGADIPSDAKIHYVISTASYDVARDTTMRIMESLSSVGRISGKRIELISDINPRNYGQGNWINQILENSYDGVVVFDLSTQLGRDASEYVKVSEYIVSLVKRYYKNCTFVFTYNTSDPGFANYVLDEVTSFLTLIPIREGRGDKKAVTNYVQALTVGTEYEAYASDVDKFMAPYKEGTYSESEAYTMFDKFSAWVLKNRKLSMYSNCALDEFRVDNAAEHVSALEELDNMIGLEPVKKVIYRMMDTSVVNRRRQQQTGMHHNDSMHMIFYGEPGTAKSTVARLVGRIAKEKGILQSGVFVKCNGNSINSEELHNAFIEAKGGVLFIDEAYALHPIVTLLQEMEERRDEVIVILAGYEGAMKEFLSFNEGLKSRIPHMVKFPSYSTEELVEIFELMLKKQGLTATDSVIEIASELFSKVRVKSDFGNGRYVREFLSDIKANQSSRLMKEYGDVELIPASKLMCLEVDDIDIPNGVVKLGEDKADSRKEFEALIGLDKPKELITNAIKRYKSQKLFKTRGIPVGKSTMHMVFTGNPGTAKTTVARYFGEVMRDEGLLSTGAFVPASKADIVIPVPGASARRVRALFEEAKGGVLFIDEAYSLSDGSGPSDEAINAIIEEMENNREDLVVIFAGYPNEMKAFIDRNPGMQSRIANYVHFDDYSVDELVAITKLIIENAKLKITDEAVDKLYPIFEAARENECFGNGRYSRTVAEMARDNLLCRVADMDIDNVSEEDIITILPEDISVPDNQIKVQKSVYKIGFAS